MKNSNKILLKREKIVKYQKKYFYSQKFKIIKVLGIKFIKYIYNKKLVK